jgi:AcrR family transcriptional regulator
MRNVEHTKQRLMGAATAEFADRGLAGARIDRIADQAGVNKALIYAYFGNKEALFGAVIGAAIQQVIADVPIDAADLPGYAARRFATERCDRRPLHPGATPLSHQRPRLGAAAPHRRLRNPS